MEKRDKRPAMRPATVKAYEAELRAWDGAAARAGMSRHAWMRLILNVAAECTEVADQIDRVEEHLDTM